MLEQFNLAALRAISGCKIGTVHSKLYTRETAIQTVKYSENDSL